MTSRTTLIRRLWKHGLDPMGILILLALRKALAGCESVLDIGCGASLTMRHLGVPKSTGFDGYEPSVEKARRLRTPGPDCAWRCS